MIETNYAEGIRANQELPIVLAITQMIQKTRRGAGFHHSNSAAES